MLVFQFFGNYFRFFAIIYLEKPYFIYFSFFLNKKFTLLCNLKLEFWVLIYFFANEKFHYLTCQILSLTYISIYSEKSFADIIQLIWILEAIPYLFRQISLRFNEFSDTFKDSKQLKKAFLWNKTFKKVFSESLSPFLDHFSWNFF